MIEDAVTRDAGEYFESEEIWPFGHGLLCTGNLYTPEGLGALAILAVDRDVAGNPLNETFNRLLAANGQRLLLTFNSVASVRNLSGQLETLAAGMEHAQEKEKQS